MKKRLLAVALLAAVAATVGASVVIAAPKGVDLNGAHYNLNLIGKKADWNGGGSYDNPDRHTMFVPADTTGWEILLNQPNKVLNHGSTVGDNVTSLPGLAIWMTQGSEFAVLDGTAFDEDADCNFQLGPGKYAVYVAAKAKPVANPAQIDGWVQAKDLEGNLYYYLNLGTISVTRKWQNATDLFMIDDQEVAGSTLPVPGEDTWIFDYLSGLDGSAYGDLAYFWQLQNNGCKLIQVRFYPV
ncbi:MAG: hypothetical protein FJ020_06280 [Chloroflexi bacterium]|nr:hypothetical protein [Chloroflexota bacterium]